MLCTRLTAGRLFAPIGLRGLYAISTRKPATAHWARLFMSTPSTDSTAEKRKPANTADDPPLTSPATKKPRSYQRPPKRNAKKKAKRGIEDEVFAFDITNFKEKHCSGIELGTSAVPETFSHVEVEIVELSSTGQGLGLHDERIYVVPFSMPGDLVTAKVVRLKLNGTVVIADFSGVVRASASRKDELISCPYFSQCSGCQLQMMSYEDQLKHKRQVIQRAYKNFSGLMGREGIAFPEIGETIRSPLQYGYRTKLTPHFNLKKKSQDKEVQVPPIGFDIRGRPGVLDIEDCPIGTETVRKGWKERKQWVKENIGTFQRGATLLLRESTNRSTSTTADGLEKVVEEKLCITDENAEFTEYVGDFKLVSPARSFFQNNNSILQTLTTYVRDNLSLPSGAPKYLVDAYCGSGLFAITCGSAVEQAIGVDIAEGSVTYATRNAEANNIKNAKFKTGKAEEIFADIDFPGSETSCVIDPPRKGCDQLFLNQLLEFLPKRIVYVSCNVHSQARDLGRILAHEQGKRYKIDSIRGFDFFPQTHHVEGVAVLTLAD